MFCPKCGTKNPSDGKFCRRCGTDIKVVSAAISGNAAERRRSRKHGSEGKVSIESAITKSFMGLAFLTVSIILGVTGVAGGKNWWFWMLIPAFGMIGSGVAQFMRLRQNAESEALINPLESINKINEKAQNALPPNQTDYVSPDNLSHNIGDLLPYSVVENTTRHLKTDSEGETMTLPDDMGN